MPHVLVAGRIHEAGIERLRRAPGFTFQVVDEVSTEAFAPHVGAADALLLRTQPLPESVIAGAPELKIVSRHGVGYDSVDVAALNARGIALAIVGDVNSVSVAEHTLMLMLAVAHRTIAYDAATRAGRWAFRNGFEATELFGKTVLVVGYGRIGRAVARLCAAFGLRVHVHDPFVDAARMEGDGFRPLSDLDAALHDADVVTLHVPFSGGPLFGARELALLKPGAVVINTGRGGLVDEAALAEALASGHVRGAGLDVFSAEPPDSDNPLLASDRVVLSPHSAGLTVECAERMAFSAADNIVSFFEGSLSPSLVVNRNAIAFGPREAEHA
ncbi:MAG: hydroxyacid dehydrogenase [Pseudochelatococcus sp.]|jgi:D-3-phosphoglycerate dehydrogenase|uniref:hydroxyacid dehydrogenase n=1 Tax=Pseudochelatococcus sp. TaxID=2020869 RepID=UPI003D8F82C0